MNFRNHTASFAASEHPTDRRALVITPTTETDEEVRATLGVMHRRMMAIAEGLSPEDARVVGGFLERMRSAVDEVDPTPAH